MQKPCLALTELSGEQLVLKKWNNLSIRIFFDIVPKPEGCKVVDYKWIFKMKLSPDSQVKHYKAHLVVKGFSQVKDIDFNEMYSPVVGHSTVWTLLALTCANGWHIHQMDAKSAFLNGDLKEEIYIKILPGQDKPEGHV